MKLPIIAPFPRIKSTLVSSLSLCVLLFSPEQAFGNPALPDINESSTISCAYVEYEPALMRDMTTGDKKSWHGVDYDIINAIAQRLNLKASFDTPTAWATMVTDLDAGKADMLCSGFWVHPNVARFALFSDSIFYQPVFIVARADDTRITSKTNYNTRELTMVGLEGDNPLHVVHTDFPEAKILSLPADSQFSQVLLHVASGKADYTIVDGYTFGIFNKNNPGKLRIVDETNPIRVYPVSYAFRKEDKVLQGAFNAAIEEMQLDGTMSRILDDYSDFPNVFYKVKSPYQARTAPAKQQRLRPH